MLIRLLVDSTRSPDKLLELYEESIRRIRTPDGLHQHLWRSVSYRQSGRILKSAEFKNVANDSKVLEKVRKGCRCEREHCMVQFT